MSEEKDILEQVESDWNACCYKTGCASEITRLRGEVERLTALASREGWVMVPREPTFDMVRNGSIDLGCRRDCTLGATRADQVWTAMLSAAPKPEEG